MRAVLALCVIFGLWQWWQNRPAPYSPGVAAPEEPVQTVLSGNSEPFTYQNFTLTPVADFRIRAKVLGIENYYTGKEASLSPVDLALGWGAMSDDKVLSHIEITQRNRFYYWRLEQFPIPRRQIETSSGNMHMIPANEAVSDALDDLSEGMVVTLSGRLVNAVDGNWKWNSSLSRSDTGKGACELIWVESVSFY
ncbi:hypothetical protein [Endozoicomonas ascidiicola]|uniref:hypothetical protein n=1 Tax=Endozoicomonas ascidiicola TaxID=1698521 RepID=UPI0008369208|nr:hypothetical protein [Endozoicomonas ascidiicola]